MSLLLKPEEKDASLNNMQHSFKVISGKKYASLHEREFQHQDHLTVARYTFVLLS